MVLQLVRDFMIKENINDDTIIMCIKQSLRCFDYVADFQFLNCDHFEEYDYKDPKPITIMINHPKRTTHPYGDISFYTRDMNQHVKHVRVNTWDEIDNDRDSIPFNDKNIGSGENMVSLYEIDKYCLSIPEYICRY